MLDAFPIAAARKAFFVFVAEVRVHRIQADNFATELVRALFITTLAVSKLTCSFVR